MPRKQRFKPSRKPKPSPPNEDAMMGRPTGNEVVHNDNVPEHDAPPSRSEDSTAELEPDDRLR